MNPRDLIETARRLVQTGATQPTQADLCRAVSTAYYALFHCQAAAGANLITGSSSHGPEWHQVYRALEHGKTRSACQQQEVMRTLPMGILAFAEVFVDLQKVRHQADYAHGGQYSKLRVLAMVDAAKDTIDQFEQADAGHQRSFAVHVLFKRR